MILTTETKGIISDLMVIIFMVIYVACIIHTFKIRNEYLIRLELLENQKMEQRMTNELRNKAAREYGVSFGNVNVNDAGIQEKTTPINEKNGISYDEYNNENMDVIKNKAADTKPLNSTINMNQEESRLIDINTCTQDEILQLPGMGIIEAKKIINFRNSNQFSSVDEFIEILNPKPHIAEKIRPMLFCVEGNNKRSNESIEKKENINTSNVGRIIDI